jgi:hypothetical protein
MSWRVKGKHAGQFFFRTTFPLSAASLLSRSAAFAASSASRLAKSEDCRRHVCQVAVCCVKTVALVNTLLWLQLHQEEVVHMRKPQVCSVPLPRHLVLPVNELSRQ